MRGSHALLLFVVLLLASGVVALFLSGASDEDVTKDLVDGERTDDGAARLVGNPRAADAVPVAKLLKSLSFDGEELAASEAAVRRRAAADGSFVEKLLALLRLNGQELQKRGLNLTQILYALKWAGPSAAGPMARHWLDSDLPRPHVLLFTLQEMGADAAPAVPVILAAVERGDVSLDVNILRLFVTVGEGARDAAPLLVELIRPPVNDGLAGTAGEALLTAVGPTPDVLAVFRDALLDEETLARPWLLTALGRQGGEGMATLVPLLVTLLEDPEEQTRAMAAFALGTAGVASKDVLLGLVRVLEDGTQSEKLQAGIALSALGEAGQEVLIEVARTAEDVTDRLAAFSAMKRAGVDTREHVDVLLDILDEKVERAWKQRALYMLSSMDPLPEPARLLPHLAWALKEPRLDQPAIITLARLPGDEAREMLITYLREVGDARALLDAARLLYSNRVEVPGLGDLLLDLLRTTKDDRTRVQAIYALPYVRPPIRAEKVLPVVERMLETHMDNRDVLMALPTSVTSLEDGEERAVTFLLNGSRLEDWGVAQRYAMSLGRYSGQAARIVPALIERMAYWAETGGDPGWGFKSPYFRLRKHWAGSDAAIANAIAAASPAAKKILEPLR